MCAGERDMATTQQPNHWRGPVSGAVVGSVVAWLYYDRGDPWMLLSFVGKVVAAYLAICCITFFGSMYVSLGAIGFLPGQPNHKYLFPRAAR